MVLGVPIFKHIRVRICQSFNFCTFKILQHKSIGLIRTINSRQQNTNENAMLIDLQRAPIFHIYMALRLFCSILNSLKIKIYFCGFRFLRVILEKKKTS